MWPAYLGLSVDELRRRAALGIEGLASCTFCPRNCRVNRLQNKTAVCKTGRYARVASYSPHLGEEDCLRGWNGSGTIFFSWCNLRCVFCQNFDISQKGMGEEAGPERLAAMMLELQARGCHNINLVTPEHVVPEILEALPIAVERGLRLPFVYNTGAYDGLESLRHLDGIVDIYMPDFKSWDPQLALKYLKARDYPEVARVAIREMHRQVGDLELDGRGLPAGRVSQGKFPEINRRISAEEYEEAIRAALEEGLRRLDSPRQVLRPRRETQWGVLT
ncbi:MAG: radical SAM protein [Deltaproteobacteria bacterium]|nr:radical SAM protein [Deltaproteobacteria bacterium]